MLSLEQMQEAAKMVEVDGVEAYRSVSLKFGEEVARLLLVAHLRRGFGAMATYPPNPSINAAVEVSLRKSGIQIPPVAPALMHCVPT